MSDTEARKKFEIALRTARFNRDEFPIPAGLPQEIYSQIMELFDAAYAAGSDSRKLTPEQARTAEEYYAAKVFKHAGSDSQPLSHLSQVSQPGKWSEAMAEVLPCGHTNAQHAYHESGELTLQPCSIGGSDSQRQALRDVDDFLAGGDLSAEERFKKLMALKRDSQREAPRPQPDEGSGIMGPSGVEAPGKPNR